MDFANLESYLAAWFEREARFSRLAALELAEMLAYDMTQDGLKVELRRPREISRPYQAREEPPREKPVFKFGTIFRRS